MAKPRTRAIDDSARRKLHEAIQNMEEPLWQAAAFVRALELVGAGVQSRNGDADGEAICVVASEALERLEMLEKHWNSMLRVAAGRT